MAQLKKKSICAFFEKPTQINGWLITDHFIIIISIFKILIIIIVTTTTFWVGMCTTQSSESDMRYLMGM